jgi:signal transduction histidine kinase/CheY-like chemotaxis protein
LKNSIIPVKAKVFLGYFTLVTLASLIIWVIYTEVLQYSREKVDFNPSTIKFKQVNAILTNLYQAESLERNYTQTGLLAPGYTELMKTISIQIDALVLMIKDPTQQIHTYNIKKLLQMKQLNLDELSAIKKTNSSNTIYRKGSKNIFTNSNQPFKSKKVADINNPDPTTRNTSGNITETRHNTDVKETHLLQKELEIMASDRTITFQLRQMLSYLEKEELIISYQNVKEQQVRVQKATSLIILLGTFALITTIIFLINILKDITHSQRYRKELEDSKAYSERLLKSKEQFMLSLTHDIKSPLNSIIGFTGFMEKDAGVTLRNRKYLENISSASHHILKLVNDLLDIARLETGQLTFDRIPFDFKNLVNHITEGFNPQAQAKNIDLRLYYQQSPSDVYMGDPARITQVLSNLISNAIKFTESGEVKIQVSLLSQSGNADQVQVEVIDTGIGISEKDIQRVFEEFNRAENTVKQYEGTGIGLTITKKIIGLMHGTIQLESQPGVGSRFTVVFPLERGGKLPDSVSQLNKEENLQSSCDMTGMRIWIIDDDQLLLDMSSLILKNAGAEVHSYTNPKEAISAFNKGCADLLITDIQMPEMNGIEVLTKIREKNGGQLNAIAVSGKNPVENEYDGFSAFIQKPFHPHTLIDVVCNQLQGMIRFPKSETSSNAFTKGYCLDQLVAFSGGNPESLNQILNSFVDSSNQNVKLLLQYCEVEDEATIAELAHKMITIFRQIEANNIVELLDCLERNDIHKLSKEHYYSTARLVIEKIGILLTSIKAEEKDII